MIAEITSAVVALAGVVGATVAVIHGSIDGSAYAAIVGASIGAATYTTTKKNQ